MKLFEANLVNAGRIIVLAILFSIFSGSSALAQQTTRAVTDQAALVSEFDVNGLKVLVKRRLSAPTVAAGLFIRGGARNLTDSNAGIESFMLDVAAEGSKKYPRETVRRELARTGTSIGASSSSDYSVFSLASTRENFDKSWDLFTDLLLNPSFDKPDVERVREGILTGLRESETDPDNYLQVLQDRVLYANHPYSRDVGGTLETIGRLTDQDLRKYHKNLLVTSRLLLVVVGDIDPIELKNRISESLGKLPAGEYTETPYPALDFSKATVDVAQRTLPTNYVQGVFEAPPLGSREYSAMRVAITLLQARVFQVVRIQNQLSYAPNAELNTLSANTANIYVTAVEANRAVELMLGEIDKLKTQTVNEDIISSIGGHFLTLYYLDQQTNSAQAAELAKYELIGGGWRNAFQFLNRVTEVTPADVQAVSRKYMRNIRFVVVGDPTAINQDVFLQKEATMKKSNKGFN